MNNNRFTLDNISFIIFEFIIKASWTHRSSNNWPPDLNILLEL